MGETAGSLIEMNIHMVLSDAATAMIVCGFLGALIALLISVAAFGDGLNVLGGLLVALMVIGIIIGIVGARMPKIKELHMCADGPVSLERIAAVYDIVDVDGKELVLRERQ